MQRSEKTGHVSGSLNLEPLLDHVRNDETRRINFLKKSTKVRVQRPSEGIQSACGQSYSQLLRRG